jgi:hypothetical protein
MTDPAGAPPVRQLGIDAFWEHRGNARAHRILPDGCMDFLFDLSTGASRVIGAMSTARVVTLPDGAHVFGIRFRPGSAVRYLDEHAGAFLDAAPELSLFRRGAFARLAAGFSDEPHLLRECRTIAGATLRTLTLERDVGFVQVEPAEPA